MAASAPRYSKRWGIQADPGWDGFPVVPSDTENLRANARSLYVGTSGDVTFIPAGCPSENVVSATGYVTIGAGSGGQRATINGVNTDVTWTTSAANTASLLKTAINANGSVNTLVSADIDPATPTQVDITAIPPGDVGNFTLAVTGTAMGVSGATMTGGDGTVTWPNVVAPFIIPMWVRRVLDTGTTAEDIVAAT